MTTKVQPTADAPSSRRYKIVWNDDGEHESNLAYSEEQIKDIDQIVYAVVRGILDKNRFDIAITHEPDIAPEGGNS